MVFFLIRKESSKNIITVHLILKYYSADLGNLHIGVEVEGVVGPSEVVGAIFMVGDMARVVAQVPGAPFWPPP